MILVVNKVDRPDSRIDEVVGESMDLLLGLASDLADEVPDLDLDAVLNVPVVYASGKAGAASLNQPVDGQLPDNDDLEPLFKTIIEHVPAPPTIPTRVLQARDQPGLLPVPGSSGTGPYLQRHPEEGPDRCMGTSRR